MTLSKHLPMFKRSNLPIGNKSGARVARLIVIIFFVALALIVSYSFLNVRNFIKPRLLILKTNLRELLDRANNFFLQDHEIESVLLITIGIIIIAIRILFPKKKGEKVIPLYTQTVFGIDQTYRTILNNASVGIAQINSVGGDFLECNGFLADLLGFRKDELIGKVMVSFVHKDDWFELVKKVRLLKEKEIDQVESLVRLVRRDEEIIWANTKIIPLRTDRPGIENYLIIVENLTKQINYRNQLVSSQASVEDLTNAFDGVIWEASTEDKFSYTFVSGKAVEILGYPLTEWINNPYFHADHVYHEDKQMVIDSLLSRTLISEDLKIEYRMIGSSGSIVWIREVICMPKSILKEKKLRGFITDITHVKNSEQALKETFALINEQNRKMVSFSHIISHNLRLHASNIDGITNLISNATSKTEIKEMVRMLKEVVGNLNDTLFNLNSVVNTKNNDELPKLPLRLREYVDIAIATHSDEIIAREARVINNVDDGISIEFNASYLKSILENIISNSLRFKAENRDLEIVISCVPDTDGWLLDISDNGVGIDLSRYKNRIFTFNETVSGRKIADGLDFYITRNKIETLGGKINVESILGEGTTFHVYFN